MGGLITFDLKDWVKKYNLTTFIETGVGHEGNGVIHAQKYDFKKILSVDIDKVFHARAVEQFKGDDRVDITLKDSKTFLNDILPIKENIFFWLDAHFPNYQMEGHFDEKIELGKDYIDQVPKEIRMPVEDELRIIIQKQDISSSVILIDDYRCYEPESGNFGDGKHVNRHILGNSNNSSFFHDLLRETHDLKIDRRHSGYLIATPKNK